ncbi:MBL fold metallo-hydrolase [Amycolatopsis sp. cmx-11-12]|uniref:MBL fold metallo-hydrolase n=1 Tax=Amycolatopsis sp. cmx-11-12 TaxID=2785795 RepID=UPI0039185607
MTRETKPPVSGPLTRRTILRSSALAAGMATVGALSPGVAAAAEPRTTPTDGTELVLLGTGAGPTPSLGRFGISSALVVRGDVYLIDCGLGAVSQYVRSGLDPARLKGIFITHLHADHIADYFTFATFMAPLIMSKTGRVPTVDVYGPPSAGALPARPGAKWVAPQHPTPGLADLTRLSNEAFAYSSNTFIAEGIGFDPATTLRVHEIKVPDVGASPIGDTAPAMKPFPVMRDKNIEVTAILVSHGAVFPSLAYRFETDHGSVVFSGDTTLTPNIPTLAADADLLVHEANDPQWWHDNGASEEFVEHMRKTHTDVLDLGKVARQSGVGSLVLSHIGDFQSTADWRRRAHLGARKAGYRGKVTVGEDLMRLTTPVRR